MSSLTGDQRPGNELSAPAIHRARMELMRMAMRLASDKDLDAVLAVYDQLLGRMFEDTTPIEHALDGDLVCRLRDFLAEKCLTVNGSKVQAKVFYEAFLAWLPAGTRPPTIHAVGRIMGAMIPKHMSNVVYYIGIKLRRE